MPSGIYDRSKAAQRKGPKKVAKKRRKYVRRIPVYARSVPKMQDILAKGGAQFVAINDADGPNYEEAMATERGAELALNAQQAEALRVAYTKIEKQETIINDLKDALVMYAITQLIKVGDDAIRSKQG